MSDIVIKAEGLSKRYRIRHQQRERYTALRDVVSDKAQAFFRPRKWGGKSPVVNEDFWALKDVSFEVKHGDVMGIIGRNGAGKSTLLKILSRITEPTEGRVELDGRTASLLEVGTGFHPELTGRENIYLNGAILGMGKAEIRRKFDEIVAFAEVEKFLDTPVKRYSSGMYVRLAFAVAAHLEPDILIVDEVLAVGDLEFQKKCLGKIQAVGESGRAVLFVSHNMAAVKSLTKNAILLDAGRMAFSGPSEHVIQRYTKLSSPDAASPKTREWGKGAHTAICGVRLLGKDGNPTTQYCPGEPLRLEILFETDGSRGMSLDLFLKDQVSARVGYGSTYQFHGQTLPDKKGRYCATLNLDPHWLASGHYSFDVTTAIINTNWDHYVESALEFEVPYSNPLGYPLDFKQAYGFGAMILLCHQAPEFHSVEANPVMIDRAN
jgi:lipopolysaccharide transport system ATP-binding protein